MMETIIIEGEEYFFGFAKECPAICAQGKTVQEVNGKIDRYYKSYITRNNENRY